MIRVKRLARLAEVDSIAGMTGASKRGRSEVDARVGQRLREGRLRVENFAARLEAVSYAAVLARGFALVTNAKGVPVASAAQVSPGAALTIKFSDGDVAVKAAPVQGSLPL